MALKIKQSYADVRIGFNNSSLPLGQRNDLEVLYENAKAQNIKRWLNMFEEVPDQKELDTIKETKFNAKQLEKRGE